MNKIFLLLLLAGGAATARADWIFLPSTYSHDRESGERVDQYTPPPPAYAQWDGTYQQSGFCYSHRAIQVGNSEDHVHIVETWGQGQNIRPYGEWERPYRPGATPYSAMPYGPMSYGYGGYGGYGYGGYGGMGPGGAYSSPPTSVYRPSSPMPMNPVQ